MQQILGNVMDSQTRCVHYHTETDVIAIKMHCCNQFYACISCHNENENHPATVWPKTAFNTEAIFCGVCKSTLTITQYLQANNSCPNCQANFNPKCSNHYYLYFEQ